MFVSQNAVLALSFQIHRVCNKQLHISLKQVLHQRKILSVTQSSSKSEFDLSLRRVFASLCEMYHHQAGPRVLRYPNLKKSC